MQGYHGHAMQDAIDPRDTKEKHDIQKIIKAVEAELLSYTKIMHVKPYSVVSIQRRLARSPEHPMAKSFEVLEEKIMLLSRIFKIKYNLGNLKPFFTAITYRFLNPPRQTLIEEWIKRFAFQEEGKKSPP
jgi:hypothetical protein